MSQKESKGSSEATCPLWMVTMGDAMSLLLTFFVLLLSLSSVNDEELMDVVGLMRGAMSTFEIDAHREFALKVKSKWRSSSDNNQEQFYPGETEMLLDEPVIPLTMEVRARFDQFTRRLKSLGFSERISLRKLDEGIVLTLATEALFEPGAAAIKAEGERAIEGMANLAGNIGNEIRLTLHFDPESAKAAGRASTIWGLSLGRAMQVRQRFSDSYEISPGRISVGALADRAGVDHDYLAVLLVEKVDNKELSLEELLKETAKPRFKPK